MGIQKTLTGNRKEHISVWSFRKALVQDKSYSLVRFNYKIENLLRTLYTLLLSHRIFVVLSITFDSLLENLFYYSILSISSISDLDPE